MPCGSFVSVGVLVGHRKLPEYKIKDKVYTEVDLHGDTSYIVEEGGQKYPVVPFTVDIVRLSNVVPWIMIILDGQRVCSRPLVQRRFQCTGVKNGNNIHELLFSLPRIVENQEKADPLGQHAGTLRIHILRAEQTGKTTIPVFKSQACDGTFNGKAVFHHLTKKDIQGHQRCMETGAIVTKEGRSTVSLAKSGQRVAMRYACTEELLEEIVLYYRPIVHSCTLPPLFINTKKAEGLEPGLKSSPRQPLGDVGNNLNRRGDQNGNNDSDRGDDDEWQRNLNSISGCPEGPLLPSSASTPLESEQRPGDEAKEEAGRCFSPPEQKKNFGWLPLNKVKKQENCTSPLPQQPTMNTSFNSKPRLGQIPADQIKRRESDYVPLDIERQIGSDNGPLDNIESDFIAAENIKRRESGLIPEENIKRRESGLISLDSIKRRESGLIPLDSIKRRESGMIPLDSIKRRESGMIPLDSIKRRESCLVMQPLHSSQDAEVIDLDLLEEEDWIIVSDTEDDDCSIQGCYLDDSVVYMGDELCMEYRGPNDDSILMMGDEECCIMDVSTRLSVVELESGEEEEEASMTDS